MIILVQEATQQIGSSSGARAPFAFQNFDSFTIAHSRAFPLHAVDNTCSTENDVHLMHTDTKIKRRATMKFITLSCLVNFESFHRRSSHTIFQNDSTLLKRPFALRALPFLPAAALYTISVVLLCAASQTKSAAEFSVAVDDLVGTTNSARESVTYV